MTYYLPTHEHPLGLAWEQNEGFGRNEDTGNCCWVGRCHVTYTKRSSKTWQEWVDLALEWCRPLCDLRSKQGYLEDSEEIFRESVTRWETVWFDLAHWQVDWRWGYAWKSLVIERFTETLMGWHTRVPDAGCLLKPFIFNSHTVLALAFHLICCRLWFFWHYIGDYLPLL